ncbi:MAG: hypothetical protein Q8P41_26470 [Pseudomonadota bacterium]|nr:hypothetical protein [Pseudomonadota bacterium]
MGRGASYRLPDEPRPGAFTQIVVHPMWPLLAVMFGGVWLSWPWFVVNAWALGSPTRVRETLTVVAGLAGSVALLFGLVTVDEAMELPTAALKYLFLVLVIWKIGVSYLLAELQGRSFEVYTYYGGVARNGLVVAMLGGMLLRPQVSDWLGVGWLSAVLL